jgi:hypothetical protein
LAAGAAFASTAMSMLKRCGVFWTRSGPDNPGSGRRAGSLLTPVSFISTKQMARRSTDLFGWDCCYRWLSREPCRTKPRGFALPDRDFGINDLVGGCSRIFRFRPFRGF